MEQVFPHAEEGIDKGSGGGACLGAETVGGPEYRKPARGDNTMSVPILVEGLSKDQSNGPSFTSGDE